MPKRRVLVVEDNSEAREAVCELMIVGDVIRGVKSRAGSNVFVIAYTGWEHLREEAMAAGADAFVLKPELEGLERLLLVPEVGAEGRKGGARSNR